MKQRCKLCDRKIDNGYRCVCSKCFKFMNWKYGSLDNIEKVLDEYLKERKEQTQIDRRTRYKSRWKVKDETN